MVSAQRAHLVELYPALLICYVTEDKRRGGEVRTGVVKGRLDEKVRVVVSRLIQVLL